MATDTVEPYAFASVRDASFLNRPDCRTPKKWHVDRGNSHAACANPGSWSSRCNSMLVDFSRIPVADVPESGRCRRPGCRVRWPAPAQDVRHPTRGTPQ